MSLGIITRGHRKIEPSVTQWVCQCCMLAHANGDACDCGEGDREHPSGLMGLFDVPTIESVTMGMDYDEHSCEDSEGRGTQCDCEEIPFSASQCDGCGSLLGGSRYAVTAWQYVTD